ncbi:hypothetical protein BOTBODRAFT_396250 [Botryobasidium botryosum FD-172 SS1]|uniref:Uncharacterized protein n=1 Tax=Botryobasidium botryosum (strain FD-172 SS1) TaxID=930990 RepID=A0A067MMM0_BOTB1|nr:hypothetical protein BOTBODRAFT_396250 [Botryobasidium botryosum FD-172 SS1]
MPNVRTRCGWVACWGGFACSLAILLASLQKPHQSLSSSSSLPASYINGTPMKRLSTSPSPAHPDTTVILLNWSRFENVKLLVSHLCSHELQSVIAQIVVWNNNPKLNIQPKDFSGLICPNSKIHIHNSPENLYFQARFFACANATTSFCYIQDDDYLVRHEIIIAMRARFSRGALEPIYLLPPPDALSSRLRAAIGPQLHTSTAWLGYGSLITRDQAATFIRLLRDLGLTEDEMKMADNYFAILRNRIPEIWLDEGMELGGGTPFTVGTEGDERNWLHTNRAYNLLESIMPLASSNGFTDLAEYPSAHQDVRLWRAPCIFYTCVIETNIALLPDYDESQLQGSSIYPTLRRLEDHGRKLLGVDGERDFLLHHLQRAVDGKLNTAFKSPHNAQRGDYLMLDMLGAVGSKYHTAELVLIIDRRTEHILPSSVTEVSSGESVFVLDTERPQWQCLALGADDAHGERSDTLLERSCSIRQRKWRFVRLRALQDMDVPWNVRDIWVPVMEGSRGW